MKRRLLFAVITVLMLATSITAGVLASNGLERITAHLNSGIKIILNGQAWTPTDSHGVATAPITYNDTTWLPIRAVAEAVGGVVGWDGSTGSVTLDTTQPVEYYFTRAGDKPELALIDVINSAQETLDIAIYSLTHPDIVAAIRDAAQRGVDVRLIEDRLQASGQSQTSALKILGSAGVELKQNKHSGLMHLKMTIADGKVATGGSFNYSKNAATNSDEVLTIYRDPKLVADFLARFNEMWNDDSRFETIERYIAMPDEDSGDTIIEETDQTPVSETPIPSDVGCENPVKGNRNSMIYHAPGQRDYDKTVNNVEYFCTEQDAIDAGYRKAQR